MKDFLVINNIPLFVENIQEVTKLDPLHRYLEFETDITNYEYNIINLRKVKSIKGYLDVFRTEKYNNNGYRFLKKYEKCSINFKYNNKLYKNKTVCIIQISYTTWIIPTEKEKNSVRQVTMCFNRLENISQLLK